MPHPACQADAIRTPQELSLGVRQLTLGSIDGAVGFYERCGYQGRLLLQFAHPPTVRPDAW